LGSIGKRETKEKGDENELVGTGKKVSKRNKEKRRISEKSRLLGRGLQGKGETQRGAIILRSTKYAGKRRNT